MNISPTVVLVHGAFADGSSWAAVADRLLRADVPVLVPANMLRGLNADGEYLADIVCTLGGPYAADLTAPRQAVLALRQPATVPAAFTEPPAVESAWKRHPCWSLVTT